MTTYRSIRITDYDYNLEDNRIAKFPLSQRDSSKLLVYRNGSISESTFSSVVDCVSTNDLLVFNNTRVVPARIIFTKNSGARIEVFLLNPLEPSDYQKAFTSTSTTRWECIVGNVKRWKNDVLTLPLPPIGVTFFARMIERNSDGAIVEFSWEGQQVTFGQIIECVGKVPIPPYLNREPVDEDKTRYQTVYAKPEGSVAAPTAGLHFTPVLLETLKKRGVKLDEVTLHVGAGTFRPVKSDTIDGHEMHTERFYVSKSLIDSILNSKGRIVAVGTTSMRTLESLYWLGVKCIESKGISQGLLVNQWDGFEQPSNYSVSEALLALRSYIDSTNGSYLMSSTSMIIVPGYRFRVVDTLITNFHQPRSTLLLLVAAFIGQDWRKVYDFALSNEFRFLSYGDSSILYRNK